MILLDTHVLVWMASEPKQLSRRAREAIREARERTGVAIATITLWELAWLAENGRIQISASVESFVRETVAGHFETHDPRDCCSRGPFASRFSQRSGGPPDHFYGHDRRRAAGHSGCTNPSSQGRADYLVGPEFSAAVACFVRSTVGGESVPAEPSDYFHLFVESLFLLR